MTVLWSPEARQDLFNILQFIAQVDPSAALLVVEKVEAAVQILEAHPRIGRPGRVASTRELIVSDMPYVIPYRTHGGSVEIIRVLHTAPNWPDGR